MITGASSGIGAALAKKMSAAGHPLLLLARRVERLEALGLKNCLCAKVDVTDQSGLQAAIAKAVEKFGPVDLLVNNAGVMLLGDVAKQQASEWQQMFEVCSMVCRPCFQI